MFFISITRTENINAINFTNNYLHKKNNQSKNSKPKENILFLIDYHYYYNSNNNRVDIIHFYVTILF